MDNIEQLKQRTKDYFENGDYQRSLELCREMIALEPENPGHYLKAASNLQKLGQYKDAQEFYNKAISIDPKDALAFSGRGMIQEELGDIEQAIGSFTKAIELSPSYPHFYTQRASLVLQQALDECFVYLAYLRQQEPSKAASYRVKTIAKLKRGVADLTLAYMKGSDSPTLQAMIMEITSLIEDLEREETDRGFIINSMNKVKQRITQT